MADLSRFSATNYPGHIKVTRREKPPTGSPVKQSYARVYRHQFDAVGRLFDPAAALLLEMIRQSGLTTVMDRDGWVLLSDDSLRAIGLSEKRTRHRAVQRLVTEGCIEVKAVGRHKLQYRLNPDWAKPKAKVIDLIKVRRARPC